LCEEFADQNETAAVRWAVAWAKPKTAVFEITVPGYTHSQYVSIPTLSGV
jgi:hypothetical protein